MGHHLLRHPSRTNTRGKKSSATSPREARLIYVVLNRWACEFDFLALTHSHHLKRNLDRHFTALASLRSYRNSTLFYSSTDISYISQVATTIGLSADDIGDLVRAATWSVIETKVTVIYTCLLAIQPAVQYLFPAKIAFFDTQSLGKSHGIASQGSQPICRGLENGLVEWLSTHWGSSTSITLVQRT